MRFGNWIFRFGLVLPLLAVATGAAANGDLRVVNAAKKHDMNAVRALLKEKADVNASLGDGATALHWAAYWEDLEATDLLIRAGASVDAVNDYGATPLWLACSNGNASVVGRLLKAGAKPNTALPTGETPLMTAAHTGKVDVVAALIARGADVNAKESTMGQTALMWAIAEHHRDIVRTLVEHGADVHAHSDGGFSPFLFAARSGDIDTAKFLISKGADFKDAAKDKTTALHVSVVRGHIPFVKFLLDLGADPNNIDPGYTALHWAAGTWESIFTHEYVFAPGAATLEHEWMVLGGVPAPDKQDLIKALLAHGADVNARVVRSPPRYGSSLFHGNLLTGGTPFYLATVTADLPTMRLLLASGADPKINANDGTTPLIMAVGLGRTDSETLIPEARHIEAVKVCLDLGQDINGANAAGVTPMHAAAIAGLDGMVQYLFDHGAKLNTKNKKGETPTKIADGYEEASMLYTRPTTAALLRKLGGLAKVE